MNNSVIAKQNNKNTFKEFLNRTLVRALVNAILEIGLAVYTALVREWNIITYSILAVLVFLSLAALVFYTVQTSNARAAISKLQERNAYLEKKRTSDQLLKMSMLRSCEITVTKITKIIEDTLSGVESLSLKIWNYQYACETAVHKMHLMLKALSNDKAGKFEMYIAHIHRQSNACFLRAIACSSDEAADPEILNKNRNIEEDEYFDSEYVRTGTKEIKCLMGHEEVSANLRNRTRCDGTRKTGEKYNQVFLVPIFCRRTKLIGVLVIACLGDTRMADTKEEAKEFIVNQLGPYLELLVIFYKIEKLIKLKAVK